MTKMILNSFLLKDYALVLIDGVKTLETERSSRQLGFGHLGKLWLGWNEF